MSRTALLAKVHIAKKDLRLDEDVYRGVLQRTVQKHSAGDCSDKQLGVLLAEFVRLGWKGAGKQRPLSPRGEIRLIYALWKDIRPLLDGTAGERELRAFVRKQTGMAAPEFCDHAQAVLVIEGLKGWLGKLRAAGVRVAP